MPHSNYKEISELFIKHLYCKGKLSMRDTLIRFAEKGYDVNGSSSPIAGQDWQKWSHLSIGVEHLFEFHTGCRYSSHTSETQIEPVVDGLSKQHQIVLQLYMDGDMPESDGTPIPTWLFGGHQSNNHAWELLYEIPFRFAKGYRKKYPHNINHLHNLDW